MQDQTDDTGRQMGEIVATLDMSPKFYDDHVSRECPSGKTISRSPAGGNVKVAFDLDGLEDLIDDAKYYADRDGGWDPELRPIQAAARTMIRRIDSQGGLDLVREGLARTARIYAK
jgi:hypothetical protein